MTFCCNADTHGFHEIIQSGHYECYSFMTEKRLYSSGKPAKIQVMICVLPGRHQAIAWSNIES